MDSLKEIIDQLDAYEKVLKDKVDFSTAIGPTPVGFIQDMREDIPAIEVTLKYIECVRLHIKNEVFFMADRKRLFEQGHPGKLVMALNNEAMRILFPEEAETYESIMKMYHNYNTIIRKHPPKPPKEQR